MQPLIATLWQSDWQVARQCGRDLEVIKGRAGREEFVGSSRLPNPILWEREEEVRPRASCPVCREENRQRGLFATKVTYANIRRSRLLERGASALPRRPRGQATFGNDLLKSRCWSLRRYGDQGDGTIAFSLDANGSQSRSTLRGQKRLNKLGYFRGTRSGGFPGGRHPSELRNSVADGDEGSEP